MTDRTDPVVKPVLPAALPPSSRAILSAKQGADKPIDMLLFCPKCGIQHVDEPDERTPDWSNPPHRSHLCHGCGCIWRPADVPTNGVVRIATVGKADAWGESNSAALALPPSSGAAQPTTIEADGDKVLRDLIAAVHNDALLFERFAGNMRECWVGTGKLCEDGTASNDFRVWMNEAHNRARHLRYVIAAAHPQTEAEEG